jgi:hypothetical protein
MPISWNEIRHNAVGLSRRWAGTTSETAEKQTFWNEFFQVFGLPRRLVATFEEPVRRISGQYGHIDLFWKRTLLVEHKSFGQDLGKAQAQAFQYIQDLLNEGRQDDAPRYVIVSDFARIALHDLEPEDVPVPNSAFRTPQSALKGPPVPNSAPRAPLSALIEFPLAEFHKHIHAFAFIPGYKQHKFQDQDPINLKATEIMGNLHDALEAGGYTGHQLERFLVRVLFCLFAEDTALFEREAFRLYLENRTAEDGSDLGMHLARLFRVLDTHEDQRQKNLDETLAAFPYVNGELFREHGLDTLFNQFAQQARAACSQASPRIPSPRGEGQGEGEWTDGQQKDVAAPKPDEGGSASSSSSSLPSALNSQTPKLPNSQTPSGPWNLYFKVTIVDAIELGLLDVINRTQDSSLAPNQFLADCRSRAGSDEIFEQSYMCNPQGATASHIVDWSAIERCRYDYEIERVHLEADPVSRRFGEFSSSRQSARESAIEDFLDESFPEVFKIKKARLGFDVAASGQGDLAAFYIDEPKGSELWLRGLLTARTEDWNFLKTVLFYFLRKLNSVKGAGDESGLGRQICWEAAQQFSYKFLKVNFASKKHDLGFALMNQLSVAEKRFPKSEHDIAADFFALRKSHTGTRCVFSEGRNTLNPSSHCDIAWAGALSTHAHTETKHQAGALVGYDHWDGVNASNAAAYAKLSPEERMLWSNDPAIWRPWR